MVQDICPAQNTTISYLLIYAKNNYKEFELPSMDHNLINLAILVIQLFHSSLCMPPNQHFFTEVRAWKTLIDPREVTCYAPG